MKALIFDKSKYDWETSKGFELVDIPEPVLDEAKNPGDADYVIMKVHYAGVCGTDRGIWNRQAFRDAILNSIDNESVIASPSAAEGAAIPSKGKIASDALAMTKPKTYRVIGHEFFGEIVKVGSNVKNIKPGDFASCESHVVCNKCYNCLRGQKEVCTNEKILGISHDGGFAEYAKVPAHIVWVTDTGKIRPEVAAMQEPFGNAVHAASKVDLKGKSVAIFGLGPIGMFLTIIAKGLGAASIIGVEPNPIAADMARKLGIDYVIPLKPNTPVIASASDLSAEASAKAEAIPSKKGIAAPSDALGLAMTTKPYAHDQAVTDEIKKITNGVGVDVSFEMAGFNSSVNNCLYATRRGGEIVLFGIKQGDFVFEDYNRLIVHGFTFHAVIGRQIWQTWERTKSLMEDASNGVQEKLFNIILDRGNGTILPIEEYNKKRFEEMMAKHPKFLIQF
jgi:threonine 3-dehydrogenase